MGESSWFRFQSCLVGTPHLQLVSVNHWSIHPRMPLFSGWRRDINWSNYSDLTRPGPPKGSKGREIPLFQGNLGW